MGKVDMTLVVLAGVLLGGCASMSPEQQAYNACVDPYNDTFRSLPGDRAMVSGGSLGGGSCYWAWDAVTQAAAVAKATERCKAKFSNCYLFADTSGMTDRTREISNNGGTVPGYLSDDELASGLNAFVTGAAIGLGAYGAGQGAPGYSMRSGLGTPASANPLTGIGAPTSPSPLESDTPSASASAIADRSPSPRAGSPTRGAGGCAAREEALRQKVEQITAEVRSAGGGYGMCRSARALENVLIDQVNLLTACPMVDPSGGQRAESTRALEETREVQRAICVG